MTTETKVKMCLQDSKIIQKKKKNFIELHYNLINISCYVGSFWNIYKVLSQCFKQNEILISIKLYLWTLSKKKNV